MLVSLRPVAILMSAALAAWGAAPDACAWAASPEMTIRTLDGRTWQGKLQQLDGQQVVVAASDGEQRAATASLLSAAPVDPPPAAQPAIWVDLVDGSRLAANDYASSGGRAKFKLGDEAVEIPVQAVRVVRLREATPEIEQQWRPILEAAADGDLLVLRKGDSIDYLSGAVGQVGGETVQFELDETLTPVKRERLDGIVYFRPQAGQSPTAAVCVVRDAAGSVLHCKAITAGPLGVQLETPWFKAERSWADVVHLDFSAGKVLALAEAEPASVKVSTWVEQNVPSLLQWRQPRRNSWGKRGGEIIPLKLRGQVFENGLALRSRTELTYRIRGQYSRLTAVAGIDDEVEGLGHVRLVIRGDNQVLFDEPIAGHDAPRPIDLDVRGVGLLTILVDFGEGGDTSDYLDLCEARLLK